MIPAVNKTGRLYAGQQSEEENDCYSTVNYILIVKFLCETSGNFANLSGVDGMVTHPRAPKFHA